jgi:RHS repeat-associated protein
VLTIKDWLDKTGNNPQTQTFTYDALDRLTSAKAEYGTNGIYLLQNYTYNATTGNLESKAGVNYTYDTAHKHAVAAISTGMNYAYDANGNQTARWIPEVSSTGFTYDAENRLVGVSGGVTATFTYDGDGNRVKGVITSGTTTTSTYIGSYFEWTGSTSTMKKYYYAGSTRVAMRTGSSTPNYLLGDHLGSNAITTNSSGVRIAEIRYYPWGTTRYTYGTSPTTYQYTGQRVETSLGLLFYNARWYDPALGRFLQADTLVPGAGNPQAYDRYAYVLNSPINYTDPSGHHYCDSEYAADEVCDWYNKAELPDDVCRADITCYQAYLTYNELIFQLGRIPTVEEILYMTAQTEGYSNKGAEYHGSGTYAGNFVEGLARNYYQPYKACNIGSWTCTESKLYKFMSGYQPWIDKNKSPYKRATDLIDKGLNNDNYGTDLNTSVAQITNIAYARTQHWTDGIFGDQPWQWYNWVRPPEPGEALGWIYVTNFYGNYFWIMTADQTWNFQHEIKPK